MSSAACSRQHGDNLGGGLYGAYAFEWSDRVESPPLSLMPVVNGCDGGSRRARRVACAQGLRPRRSDDGPTGRTPERRRIAQDTGRIAGRLSWTVDPSPPRTHSSDRRPAVHLVRDLVVRTLPVADPPDPAHRIWRAAAMSAPWLILAQAQTCLVPDLAPVTAG